MKKLLLIAGLLLTGAAQLNAQTQTIALSETNGWSKIGESTANFRSQTQDIMVTGDTFDAIKIQVSQTPIYLESFDIHFANGTKQTVEYGGFDAIPLKGKGEVTKVTIRYRYIDENPGAKARLELVGLKTNLDDKNSKVAAR